MIQLSALPRSMPATDHALRGARSPGSFIQSLAAFLDAGEDAPEAKISADKGKDVATDGKALPDEERTDDKVLAWLATIAPSPAPILTPPVAGAIGGPATPSIPGGIGTVSTPPFALGKVERPFPPSAPTSIPESEVYPERLPWQAVEGLSTNGRKADTVSVTGRITLDPVRAMASEVQIAADPIVRDGQVDGRRVDMAAAPLLSAAPAPVAAPTTPVTAAQLFGAAMREAAGHDDKSPRTDAGIVPLAPPPAQVEAQRHAVAATAEAQQAPLDMGHDRWPHRMIERIESMRDAADAADTRIRLVPDALGAIDVSMRRDGDAVHVHFAAEQAATRALLTDAQPRLAELAEARGIRLGGSAVDSGGADARQNRAPAPPPIPQAPAPVTAAPATTDDARIA